MSSSSRPSDDEDATYRPTQTFSSPGLGPAEEEEAQDTQFSDVVLPRRRSLVVPKVESSVPASPNDSEESDQVMQTIESPGQGSDVEMRSRGTSSSEQEIIVPLARGNNRPNRRVVATYGRVRDTLTPPFSSEHY